MISGLPRASVVGAVIVNRNGGDRILRCLEALAGQVAPLHEVVVVDNGSTDTSLSRIREAWPDTRIIELGENRGLPWARNVGLRALTTGLALSLDSDIYPEPECLARLLGARERSGAALVCPRIVLLPETDIVQCDGATLHFIGTLALRHGYRPLTGLPEAGQFVGAMIGACMLIDRDRVLEAGGFDDLFFFYFEDLEFCLRLRARGERIYCEPAAVVRHDRSEGTPGLSFRGRGPYPEQRAYLSMRHRWLAILIHYRRRTLAVLLPALLLYELATIAWATAHGRLPAWARAWAWLARHRGDIRERHRRAQAARVLPDRDLLEGGEIPLAPGLLRSRAAHGLASLLSIGLGLYWAAARRLIG